MNIFNYKCLHCGAQLELDRDDLLTYCPFCGGRLNLDNIHPEPEKQDVIAEKIKQTRDRVYSFKSSFNSGFNSTSRTIHFQSGTVVNSEKKVLLFSVLGVLGLVVFFVILSLLLTTKSVIPFSQEYANKKHYSSLLTALDNSNFYNYSIVPISDEEYSDDYKDGQVIEVTVNGKAKFSTKKKYNVDKTNILIRFYSPDGKIELPISSNGIRGQDERDIEKTLKRHGFNNISENREEGLLGKIVYDDWEIISITVNGSSSFEADERLAPDTPIYIKYYYR